MGGIRFGARMAIPEVPGVLQRALSGGLICEYDTKRRESFGRARLEAVPTATQCITCKAKRETPSP